MDTNDTTKTYIVKNLDRSVEAFGLAWDTCQSLWRDATDPDMIRTVGNVVVSSDPLHDANGVTYISAKPLSDDSLDPTEWSYHPDDLVEVEPVSDGAAKNGDYVKAGHWDSFREIIAVAGDDALTTSLVHGAPTTSLVYGGGEWVPNRDLTIFRPVATEREVYFTPVDGAEVRFASLDGTEVRVTSVTGGQKGAKLARYDLMPVDALRELAEHYGKGEKKYPTEAGIPNFRKGYDISLSYAALQRHANQFWGGEDIDTETGSNHMIAAAWHALYIVQAMHDYGDRFDDRLTTSRRKLEED